MKRLYLLQRREAGRSAGHAIDQVRASHQPQGHVCAGSTSQLNDALLLRCMGPVVAPSRRFIVRARELNLRPVLQDSGRRPSTGQLGSIADDRRRHRTSRGQQQIQVSRDPHPDHDPATAHSELRRVHQDVAQALQPLAQAQVVGRETHMRAVAAPNVSPGTTATPRSISSRLAKANAFSAPPGISTRP